MRPLATVLVLALAAAPVWSGEAGLDSGSARAQDAPATYDPNGSDSCANANAEAVIVIRPGGGGPTSPGMPDQTPGMHGTTGTYGSCTSCGTGTSETTTPSPDPSFPLVTVHVVKNCSVGVNHWVPRTLHTGNPAAGAAAMTGGCGSCGAGGGMPIPSAEVGAHRGLPMADLFWRSRVNAGNNTMMDRTHTYDVPLTQSYTASTGTTTIELNLPEGGVRPRFTTTDGVTFTPAVGHNFMYHGATCTRSGDILTVRGCFGHIWQYTLPAGWDRTANGLTLRPTMMQNPWSYPVTLSYDGLGHLTQAQSLLGATTFTWGQVSGLWVIVAITDPDGRTSTCAYTQVLGRLVLSAVTHADGSRSTFTVDPVQRSLPDYNGLFTVRTDFTPNLAAPGGRSRRLWIDSIGRVPLVEDGLDRDQSWLPGSNTVAGKIWREFQDANGSLYIPIARAWSASSQARIRLGSDAITRYTIDGNNRILSEVDEQGRVTTYAYGTTSNLLASVTHPDNTQESWVRQAGSGQPLQYTDRIGRVTKAERDSRGNPLVMIYPDSTPADDSDNPRVISTFNDASQLTRKTDEAGRVTEYFYSMTGLAADAPASSQDPANHGYLVRAVLPGDAVGTTVVWTYQWDAAHQDCIQATDPTGRTTRWAYDALHRLVRTTYADDSYEEWTYGSPTNAAVAGLVVASRDRNGRVTTYGYDASGALVSTVLADGTQATTAYDEHGRVASRTNAGETTTIGYDSAGRERTVTRQATASQTLTTTVERDAEDRVIATTDAYGRMSGTVYDVDGRAVRQVQGLVPGALSWATSQAGVDALLANTTWADQDIGSPSGPAGSTTVLGDAVTLTSYGYQMVAWTDKFRLRGVPFPGDGSITCHVTDNATAQAGLVVRASSSPSAPYAGIVFQANGGLATIERMQSGQQQINYGYAAESPAHSWLRITRTGHLIVCWSSPDGVSWTTRLVSGIPMQDTAVAGVIAAPTTGVNSWTASWGSASYDQISVTKTSVLASVRAEAWQNYLRGLPRLTGANPAYVITDRSYNAASQLLSVTDGAGVQSTFVYDPRDRVVSQTEAVGRPEAATTAFIYDLVGNRTQVTSPRGIVTQMAYTQRNLVASVTEAVGTPVQAITQVTTYTPTQKPVTVTDALGRVTTYTYGVCCDRLKQITDPVGYQTAFLYDFVGNRTRVTDANGLITLTTYDARNRVSTVRNPANEITTIVHDDNLTDGVGIDAMPVMAAVLPGLGLGAGSDGSAVAVADPAGGVSYELRDGLGRTVARIDANGNASTVAYDAVVGGLVETAMTDALGHVTRARADGAGQTRQQVDALGNVSTAGFNAVGNQISQRDALGIGWDAVFDARHRLLSRSDTRTPVATTSWSYDLDGNRLSETDALGKTEDYTYDQRNRRTAILDRLLPRGTTRFAYDAVGNLTQISDADNEDNGGLVNLAGTTQYAYDVRNLLVAEAFPTGQQGRTLRVYTYDGARRLGSRQVGILDGAFSATPGFSGSVTTTSYGYDDANRLTTRGYGDGQNDGFGYDVAGRLTSATSARYATAVRRAYDAAGRLTFERLAIDGQSYPVGYAYLDDNSLQRLTYPQTGSVVERFYTLRHELAGVTLGNATVNTRTYDAAGRLTSQQWGGLASLTETRSYLAGDHLVESIAVPGITSFAYTYDAAGRKLSETGQTFGYDNAGRLLTWIAGSDSQDWSLTKVGDWASTTRNGVTETRVNESVHEVVGLTVGGSTTALTYDAQGNLTRDEQGRLLAWDPENRLASAAVEGGATYRYDALGRRVAKRVGDLTTYYLPAGAQTVVELDRVGVRSQAEQAGATADGALANLAGTPVGGSILTPPSGGDAVTRVNFQPTGAVIPDGFLDDTGKPLATRTNGLSYGWSADRSASGVHHPNAVPRPAWTTAIRMEEASWSIALPAGRYAVAVVAGDALDTNLTNNLVIGAVPVTDGSPATEPAYEAGNFDGYLQVVEVGVGGAVSIAPGVGSLNPTLCLTEIVAIPAGLADEATWLAVQQSSLAAAVDAMNTATMAPGTSSDEVREFVYGSYVDEVLCYQATVGVVTERYFPHYNHLYSVAALTDSTGAVVERFTYNAYGKQTITDATGNVTRAKSSVGFDRSFTGYQIDRETGLLHARTRAYSTSMGKFANRMPWWGMQGQVSHFALYPGVLPYEHQRSLFNTLAKRSLGSFVAGRYSMYDYVYCSPGNYLEPFSIAQSPSDTNIFGLTKPDPFAPPPRPAPVDPGDVVRNALAHLGSAAWSLDAVKDDVKSGDYKCNKFVYDILVESGVPIARVGGRLGTMLGALGSAPGAGQWGDKGCSIAGFSVVDIPHPGDVISDGDHVGIVTSVNPDGSGTTISQSSKTDRVTNNDWGFRTEQRGDPAFVIRRYTYFVCCDCPVEKKSP